MEKPEKIVEELIHQEGVKPEAECISLQTAGSSTSHGLESGEMQASYNGQEELVEDVSIANRDINANELTEEEKPLDHQIDISCSSEKQITLEVERKFIVPADCETLIESLGGTLIEEKHFQDDYYDTEDYSLTIRDYWLRQRDGIWQLKYPPEQRAESSSTSQYCETDSEDQICELLTKVLQSYLGRHDMHVSGIVPVSNIVSSICHNFASFKTKRKSYKIDDIKIDLDMMDFGFNVGEIEIIIHRRSDLSQALSRIDDLASKLGFQSYAALDVNAFISSAQGSDDLVSG
ncbi:thiamine-triphosphatase-like isoform X2 [Limulus polyphemus]|uniref:Thiamine-triphosphatase-like isoform X2 n=1 Tax=Limulus polyphemus TaxID=6850 RepID=A0ABM1C4W9_LIMPO|nr:thiamine-triphosphatase-like isoform X2 [Limulus polyphemus]